MTKNNTNEYKNYTREIRLTVAVIVWTGLVWLLLGADMVAILRDQLGAGDYTLAGSQVVFMLVIALMQVSILVYFMARLGQLRRHQKRHAGRRRPRGILGQDFFGNQMHVFPRLRRMREPLAGPVSTSGKSGFPNIRLTPSTGSPPSGRIARMLAISRKSSPEVRPRSGNPGRSPRDIPGHRRGGRLRVEASRAHRPDSG